MDPLHKLSSTSLSVLMALSNTCSFYSPLRVFRKSKQKYIANLDTLEILIDALIIAGNFVIQKKNSFMHFDAIILCCNNRLKLGVKYIVYDNSVSNIRKILTIGIFKRFFLFFFQ